MKLKRTTALLLAGMMAAGMLSGCGGASSDGGSAAASSSSDKDHITCVLAIRGEFQGYLTDATIAAAEELGNYEVTVQNAENDVSKQLQYVETCRNAGEKAIILQMVDADTAQTLIDAAGDMKVIFVNCPPTDMSVLEADNVAYVGSDEYTAGYMQGEYLANYFKKQGKTDISYIMLQGQLGYVATIKRTEGALDAMEKNGLNITPTTAPLVCDFDRPTAQENVAPLIGSGAKFDCIIANNDAMALGAVEAVKSAGRDIDFPICGVDCTADGAQAIQDGDLAMTVFQDPVGQGRGALLAADNMIRGEALNKGMEQYELDDTGEAWSDHVVWVPFELVTADNVSDFQ